MMTKWKILNTPEMEKQREEEELSNIKKLIDGISNEKLSDLAVDWNMRIYREEQEKYKLINIATQAHYFLSEPNAKRELIEQLVKSGFWIPRIKRFKPVHTDSDDYIYFVTASNIIGETKLFGHIGKQKETLSFSAWIDERIPIKYWNIYQVDVFDKGPINGKHVMKVPYQEPENGIFNLNISGAKDFDDDTIFIIAKADNGPSFTTCEYNGWEDFKKKMDEK